MAVFCFRIHSLEAAWFELCTMFWLADNYGCRELSGQGLVSCRLCLVPDSFFRLFPSPKFLLLTPGLLWPFLCLVFAVQYTVSPVECVRYPMSLVPFPRFSGCLDLLQMRLRSSVVLPALLGCHLATSRYRDIVCIGDHRSTLVMGPWVSSGLVFIYLTEGGVQAQREKEHAQRARFAYRTFDWYRSRYMAGHSDGRRNVALHPHQSLSKFAAESAGL